MCCDWLGKMKHFHVIWVKVLPDIKLLTELFAAHANIKLLSCASCTFWLQFMIEASISFTFSLTFLFAIHSNFLSYLWWGIRTQTLLTQHICSLRKRQLYKPISWEKEKKKKGCPINWESSCFSEKCYSILMLV